MVFMAHLIAVLLVYKFFGFEIGIIFGISLSAAIISMGFAGVENIIIKKNN
jgi:MFS superfamily sulfate permease-like transporter